MCSASVRNTILSSVNTRGGEVPQARNSKANKKYVYAALDIQNYVQVSHPAKPVKIPQRVQARAHASHSHNDTAARKDVLSEARLLALLGEEVDIVHRGEVTGEDEVKAEKDAWKSCRCVLKGKADAGVERVAPLGECLEGKTDKRKREL